MLGFFANSYSHVYFIFGGGKKVTHSAVSGCLLGNGCLSYPSIPVYIILTCNTLKIPVHIISLGDSQQSDRTNLSCVKPIFFVFVRSHNAVDKMSLELFLLCVGKLQDRLTREIPVHVISLLDSQFSDRMNPVCQPCLSHVRPEMLHCNMSPELLPLCGASPS